MIVHHAWLSSGNHGERINFNHIVINDFHHCLRSSMTTNQAYNLMMSLVPWFRVGTGINPHELNVLDVIGYRIDQQNFANVQQMMRANGYTVGAENRIREILAVTCDAVMIVNEVTCVYRMEINLLCDTFPT